MVEQDPSKKALIWSTTLTQSDTTYRKGGFLHGELRILQLDVKPTERHEWGCNVVDVGKKSRQQRVDS